MAVIFRPDRGDIAVGGPKRRRDLRRCGEGFAIAIIAAGLSVVAGTTAATAQGIPAPGEAVTEPFRPPRLSNPPAGLPVAPTPFAPTQSESVVMNLIRLLVEQGLITPEAADALIAQARAEAEAAKPTGVALSEPGRVSVPYIPAPVREQITEEIKQDVLIKAKAYNWASPGGLPEWVSRFRLFGDLRSRFEYVGFSGDNFDGFVDFNEINSGDPFVFNTGAGQIDDDVLPFLNTTEDRNRFRLRGRLGVEATIDEGVTATIRLASGNDSGPVSTNQTLGAVSETGEGGNFSKYQIWLDQAYLRFKPIEQITIDLGRAPNPFFRTNLIWDDDLQLDGASISGEYALNSVVTPFFAVGAFPVYNTAFNFSSDLLGAQESRNRYMIGSQIGARYKPDPDVELSFGAANYYFSNMQGEIGDCDLFVDSGGNFTDENCPTDDTRQQFGQKGNTLIPLRNNMVNLVDGFIDPTAPVPNPQYFGLASEFNILALNLRFDYGGFKPIHIIFDAEYINNLAFDEGSFPDVIFPYSGGVAGFAADRANTDLGNQGFYVNLAVGHPRMEKRWDWKAGLGYRYLESDAAVDSFVDSDFHLGGTNAKGFILQGELGIAKNTWVAARWLTSQEIAGEPLDIDVIQVDLNARF